MTKIPWTEESWNPVIGCTKIATGCKNCYAERFAWRLACMGKSYYNAVADKNGWTSNVLCREDTLKIPLHWRNPRKIFVCSMGDLFHEKVPFEDIDKVIGTIELCQQHILQILTKRPERALEYFKSNSDDRAESINLAIEKFTGGHLAGDDMVNEFCKQKGITRKYRDRLNYNENIWVNRTWQKPLWPAPHIWIGTSISTQADADKNIPILLQIPAAVRFVSLEPMLERVDILKYLWLRQKCVGKKGCGFTGASYEFDNPKKDGAYRCPQCGKNHSYLVTDSIDQLIIGCESGPKQRPCEIEWIRDAVRQCKEAGVACFVKQVPINGRCSKKPEEWPEDLRVQEYPNA